MVQRQLGLLGVPPGALHLQVHPGFPAEVVRACIRACVHACVCVYVWSMSGALRTLTVATSLPQGDFRALLCPGLEQQSCEKSQFLFIHGHVRKDGVCWHRNRLGTGN